jgi:type IV pilus assembly protein PilA
VVAIIAILAAIAIPQYQNYITKSQFTESQTIADGLKNPILVYRSLNDDCPTASTVGSGILAPASYAGKYVRSAKVGAASAGVCTVTVTFKQTGSVSKPLNGKSVTFTLADHGGSFTWACAAANIADRYKPVACR